MLGTVGSKPLQLLANVLLAHALGPTGLGELGLANSAAVTLSGITGMGLGDALNRFLAEHFRKDPTRGTTVGVAIIWVSVIGVFLVFGGLWVFRSLWSSSVFPPSTSDLLVGLCLVLGYLNVLGSLANNAFSGLQLFREVSFLGMLQVSVVSVLSVVAAYFMGMVGAITGYIIGSLCSITFGAWRLWCFHSAFFSRPTWACFSSLKEVIQFSVPVWLGYFIVGPFTTLSLASLAAQPNGSQELGLFNTANALKMLVATLPGILGSALNPAIMEEGGRHGNSDAYHRLLDRAFAATMFLCLPIVIPILFCSDVLFLVYDNRFIHCAVLFPPLVASVAIALFSSIAQFILVAKGKVWLNLILGGVQYGLLYLLARWWTVDHLASGLAWSTFVAGLSGSVLLLEVAIKLGAAPRRLRRIYYGYMGAVAGLLLLAVFLPTAWRWALSLPLSLVVAVFLLRRFKELPNWIVASVPVSIRPLVGRCTRFATA